MINALRRRTVSLAWIAAVTFVVATPVLSQAPTDAQRSAIRSECRSDYQAHCASIPPGGMASLQCLQKNMSSLSPGCQSAVRAVEAPAESKSESKSEPKTESKAEPKTEPKTETRSEPKTESKPETTTETKAEPAPAAAPAKPAASEPAAQPKAAAGTAARKPSSSQIAAIRSACRSDYQQNCAGVPTGGAPALQCLEKNKSKLSASCQKAVTAATDGGASPASAGAPAAASVGTPGSVPADAPAPVLVLRPMRPLEELRVLRSACGGDARALCGAVQPGGGRIIQCLATQAASLSPACKDVLGQFAAQ
jgi:hypothetical protein